MSPLTFNLHPLETDTASNPAARKQIAEDRKLNSN